MDLNTIEKNIKEHRYTTITAFRKDIEQVRKIKIFKKIKLFSYDFRYSAPSLNCKKCLNFQKIIFQLKVNSEIYNGPASTSLYTQKAVEIVNMGEKLIEKHRPQLSELEANIRTTMEAEGGSVTDDSYDYDRPGTSSTHQESQMILADETTQMSMRTVSEFSEGQLLREGEELEEEDIILGKKNTKILKKIKFRRGH